MSMVKDVKGKRKEEVHAKDMAEKKAVTNYMGGVSYQVNPMDTLKLISASSIFGEPQYYRRGEFEDRAKDGILMFDKILNCDISPAELIGFGYEGKSTSDVMEEAIDSALSFDFEGTLRWAQVLRSEYYMRLNPQIIMVRAALHEGREDFTTKNPGLFHKINMSVMQRADDVTSQITYYLYKNGNKNKVPGILKKSWARKISSLTDYEVYKYRNHGIGLIDAVRISHANSPVIDELMLTGTVKTPEGSTTWENLRANGKSWTEILSSIKMGHMALLRNLRGIFEETSYSYEEEKKILTKLETGVKGGKQFPFRYLTAKTAIVGSKVANKANIFDSLENCMDISCENLPRLKGNNAFLSDNSGSAWGTFSSEYGSMCVAKIGNLSSVIGAANSDRGTVFAFGDSLKRFEISKREGILSQAEKISGRGSSFVGGGTENGIWLFFEEAINDKIHYDNIFIYSDMQAGHGGLYGRDSDMKRCRKMGACVSKGMRSNVYIDVAKLVKIYREKVNPKVNVFCIQTAGYDNVLIPENTYRTAVMYGWTGKELLYADAVNKLWDEIDERGNNIQ